MSRLPLLLVPLLALAGCGSSEPPSESGKTGMAAVSEKAMGELRDELAMKTSAWAKAAATRPRPRSRPPATC